MTLPVEGPCAAWITWDEVTRCTAVDLSTVDVEVQADTLVQVSEILFALTGGRYPGICEATRALCYACACSQPRCVCSQRYRIDLGHPAVDDVIEVLIDGVALPRVGHWRVDDWRYLVRIDGEPWPRSIDLDNLDEFTVTWTYGRLPPTAGKLAAARFAAELAAACVPGAKCNLPSRVTSVQREGVTYTILDSMRMLDEGRTGFYPADLWVMADNLGAKARPAIFDPAACGQVRVAQGTDDGGS